MTTTTSPYVRRVSSADAGRSDLYNGPIVVTPPEDLEERCDADDIATALERAKTSLEETASDVGTPEPEPERPGVRITDKFAIAFDIDGVLVKGAKALPRSFEALRYINGKNPWGLKM